MAKFGPRPVPPPQAEAGKELLDRRTAVSKTFVGEEPGQLRTTVFQAPVHFKDPQGRWVDIDDSLGASRDGRRHNGANVFGLSIAEKSTDKALARLDIDDKHSVGFALDGAAEVKARGDAKSVTYAKVHKDTDVRLTSLRSGVKEELVLASPAAPDRFVFPLELKGLTASLDEAGNVIYRDGAGVERARTPHGFMTDARIDPRSGESEMSLGVTYALIAWKGGTALEVRLDRAWLDDPARRYPVTVDPDIHHAAWGDDTYVMSGFYRDNSYDAELKVGTYDGGYHIGRSFVRFDTGVFAGATVQHAEMHLAERHSWNCGYWPEHAYRVTGGWDGRNMPDWSNQPPVDPNGVGGTWEGTICGSRTAKWNVTGMAATWAAAGQPEASVSLRATNESDNNRWKKYASTEAGAPPALHVWYNRPPVIPYGVTPAYNAADPRIFTSTTTASAFYADPDGGSGQIAFGLWNGVDQMVWSAWSPSVCSGCQTSVSIPAQPDGWYYVRAIGWDGVNTSSDFSPTKQWFFIDTRAPMMPTQVVPATQALLGPSGSVSAQYGEPYNWPGYVLFRAVDAAGQIFDAWSAQTCGGCTASAKLPLVHGAVYTLYTIAWDIGLVSSWAPTQSFAYMPMETTFTLNAPTSLTSVSNALRPTGRHPVSFVQGGAVKGGHATRGVTVDDAVTTYRDQYAQLASGEPQISTFTVEGQIQTASLGSLASSVVQRDEVDPVATLAASSAASSTSAAPASKPWAPAFGQTQTSNFLNGQRKILQDMTWDSQASLDAFGAEAYEHDFKLFNPDNSGAPKRPFCATGEEQAFWATRSGVTLIHNYPDNAKPYFDTDALDPCSQQDLTVGLYYPGRLQPGVLYRTELVVKAGTKSSSTYQLFAQKLERYCDRNPFCVGTKSRFDVDPTQALITTGEGALTPECRSWVKGQASQICTTPPPPIAGNKAPTVDAGPSAAGAAGTAIRLVGTASDPDGDLVLLRWTYVAGPGVDPAARCLFSDPAKLTTTINCTLPGTYTAKLQADDALNPPVFDTTVVTVS